VLNDSLRFRDEFVRHKMLDLIGDLFLLGRPLQGHVIARNAGHALHHRLVLAIEKAEAAQRRLARSRPVATVTVSSGQASGDSSTGLPGIAAL
jgi:UDP-3-O-acyl-N-acetylglucosamine deacetylase